MRSRTRLIISSLLMFVFLCVVLGYAVLSASFSPFTSSRALRWTAEQLLTHPQPTPDFHSGIEPYPGFKGPYSGSVSFYVWACGIWEPGDQPSILDAHVWSNLRFEVDGKAIDKPKTVWDLLGLFGECDENGQNCGGCGGPFQGSFPVPLSTGLHIASVQTRSMSGIEYSYSWAFQIVSTNPLDVARMAAATIIAQTQESQIYRATETAWWKLDPTMRASTVEVTRAVISATQTAESIVDLKRYNEARAARTKTAQASGGK